MVIAEARKKLDEKLHGGYNRAFDGNTLRVWLCSNINSLLLQ